MVEKKPEKEQETMNNNRRKEIESVVKSLEILSGKIKELYDEEINYQDNMPENLLNSERYETSEAASDALESAKESIDEAVDLLREII